MCVSPLFLWCISEALLIENCFWTSAWGSKRLKHPHHDSSTHSISHMAWGVLLCILRCWGFCHLQCASHRNRLFSQTPSWVNWCCCSLYWCVLWRLWRVYCKSLLLQTGPFTQNHTGWEKHTIICPVLSVKKLKKTFSWSIHLNTHGFYQEISEIAFGFYTNRN